jgi:two-component system OmpR family sensor kinase
MTRRLTLRARVALATALAIVLAVVLLGSATLALVGRQLHRSLDRGLHDRAAEVARLVATTPALVTAPGVLEGRVGTSAAFVQVVDREGRIVARSAALGGRVLPAGAPLSGALRARRAGYADARLGDERLRVYAAPLGGVGGGAAAGGAVAVAGSTSTIANTLRPLRHVVLLAALASAALAAALALLATRRALAPLTRLTAGAEQIARTGDPGRRLPQDGGRDEVGRLAATLNAMLEALERARERERRFVGDASHELRTPLTALRGNAAYVARHGADPAALADLEADAERLAALLDDLLALAREDAAQAPAREPVDLGQLARAVAAERPAVEVEVIAGSEPPAGRQAARAGASAGAAAPGGGAAAPGRGAAAPGGGAAAPGGGAAAPGGGAAAPGGGAAAPGGGAAVPGGGAAVPGGGAAVPGGGAAAPGGGAAVPGGGAAAPGGGAAAPGGGAAAPGGGAAVPGGGAAAPGGGAAAPGGGAAAPGGGAAAPGGGAAAPGGGAAAPGGGAAVPDAGPPIVVLGDRAALERALRNLIENAERHGPAGGRIAVRVATGGARATLAVTDEGAGLAPEQAEQAFARFWRGPGAAPGGTGLGLAIVRATAERHGGRATADGSTFAIELPLAAGAR